MSARGAEQPDARAAHRLRCPRSCSDHCYWCVRSPCGTAAPHSGLGTVLLGRSGLPPRRWRMGQTVPRVRWRARLDAVRLVYAARFGSRGAGVHVAHPHLPKNRLPAVRFQGRTFTEGATRTQHAATLKYSDPGQPAPSDRHAIDAHHGARQSAHLRREARRGARVGDAAPGELETGGHCRWRPGRRRRDEPRRREPPPRRRGGRRGAARRERGARSVEARPWCCGRPTPRHERNAVLRACDQNVKRALAAKLGTDEKYGEARAPPRAGLRVAYERHGVLSTKGERPPEHVRIAFGARSTARASARAGGVVPRTTRRRGASRRRARGGYARGGVGGPARDSGLPGPVAAAVIKGGEQRRSASGPCHGAAGDAGRCQTRGRRQALLRGASRGRRGLRRRLRSAPAAWRHVLGEDDAKLVEDAAGRALIELHALKGTSLGKRASTCAVAVACLGIRRSFDDGDRFSSSELLLVLLRLLSLPPGHSAEGATDGAQRVVSDLDEHDPELARHLRAASGGPQQLRALLAARVDVYLTTVFPLDAIVRLGPLLARRVAGRTAALSGGRAGAAAGPAPVRDDAGGARARAAGRAAGTRADVRDAGALDGVRLVDLLAPIVAASFASFADPPRQHLTRFRDRLVRERCLGFYERLACAPPPRRRRRGYRRRRGVRRSAILPPRSARRVAPGASSTSTAAAPARTPCKKLFPVILKGDTSTRAKF